MKSCIVKPHKAGLFSLINKAITCAEIYDHVHVDWTGDTLYSRPQDGNLWDHLFEPTTPPEGEATIITDYPHPLYTFKHVADLYEGGHQWRQRLNACWSRFKVRDDVLAMAAKVIDQFQGKNVVSVLVRANCHGREQVDEKNQALEDYKSAIEWGPSRYAKHTVVHTVCGDMESLRWFQERFTVIYDEETVRSESRDVDRHQAVEQFVEDAKRALAEVIAMSRADFLVHPVSNMATAALYMNPDLRSVYLK